MTICTKCAGQRVILSAGVRFPCSRCVGSGGAPGVFYAGIGSRETPEPIQLQMQSIAMQLAMRGYVLRSGAAVGADKAFEKGCDAVAGRKVIRCATHWQPAIDHAQRYHPAWDRCTDAAKALHGRNSLIMLGDDLDLPVAFVVCWTPGGEVTGGTGQALRIAADPAYNVPVFNLAVTPAATLWEWLNG
jgi:hypothetical protein